MTSNGKILIISYVFPPHPGIGGRRWAKFAKYLTRKDQDVYVVCACNPDVEISAWIGDVEENERIHLFPVDSFFPKVLSRKPSGIIEKVMYKFWQYYTSFKFKGYHYDRSIFSGEKFIDKADEIIRRHQIENVIVTGAPFRLTYLVARARKNWPGVKLTVDFRDPWTWEEGGDYQKLPAKDLAYEKNLESFVINNADFISTPTSNMLKYLQAAYPANAGKFFMLPHAWDEDEISNDEKVTDKAIRIVLFGTLYRNIQQEIRELARAIAAMKGDVLLDIFSDSENYRSIFSEEGASQYVRYYPTQPSKDLFTYMKFYYAALIINNDTDKDHVSTKFIELAASSTPVIYIANAGKAADFVTNKNLGWHLNSSEVKDFFNRLRMGAVKTPDSVLDIKELSFSKVTDKLLQQITESRMLKEETSH